MYSLVLTTVFVISTGCSEYTYNVDVKLIPFKIYLIQKSTHFDS